MTEMEIYRCISFIKLAVLLLVLLTLSSSIQYAAAASDDEINIIPTADSPCPGTSNGELCFTLQQFIANHIGPNRTEFSTNTTLKFYPGEHLMDSQLSVSHVNSFTMWATKKATIFCRQPYYDYRFKFDEVQNVQVRGIILNGCRVSLLQSGPVGNAAFIKSSFVNNTGYFCCSRGGVLDMNYMSYSGAGSSVLIKQCVFSDNIGGSGSIFDSSHNLTVDQCTFKNNYGAYYEGGAISSSGGYKSILNSYFSNNKDVSQGGAVSVMANQVTIANSYFSDNVAGGQGGAVVAFGSPVVVTNCYFTDNIANSRGGALYAYGSNDGVIITDSYFSDNMAGSSGGNGGAIFIGGAFIQSGNHRDIQATGQFPDPYITISGNTFEHNIASNGGGGAIYSGVIYSSILLIKNTFSHNIAANCGAVQVSEPWFHYNASFIKNIFTHNSAMGQPGGKNEGGGMCINKASAVFSDNTFSHNTATGNAGALRVDDCDAVTIERSKFSNNVAQGDGGGIYSYHFSTNYTITQSSFANNRAGGDGGVMYVESTSSQVKIRKGTFNYNVAADRGGVIAINGSTLLINGANVCNSNNTAHLGGVVSACNSKVRISHPKIPATPDPNHPFCTLYNC